MADRLHPYPMFPQNITPNSLQQSHPQQQHQPQQQDPQMISALSNPEHARMWQQQINQLQNQYRPQQSGDLATSQLNHQMQEFARGQALSHGQGQPVVQQIQQPFALNAQRMNPSGPVFHDPQANQPQSLTQANFPNVPMNTQQPIKGAFNMNPMMNNPGVPRQLKMLTQQQEMARLQQAGLTAQHGQNQSSVAEMFASSSMQPSQDQMHSSPHPATQPIGPPGTNQVMASGNLQANQQNMMTPSDFLQRRNYLARKITNSEQTLASLMQTARSGSIVEPQLQQQIAHVRSEIATHKNVYSKFLAIMSQHAMDNPSNVSHLNPMAHAVHQQPPQPTNVSKPQVQPPFFSQANQPYKFPAGNGPSPMPSQTQGTLSQQIPIQPPQIGQPNTIPLRTAGTPQQIPGGPNSMSPNLGNFVVQGGQKVPDQTRQSEVIKPLDKERFESAYSQFCRSQRINPGDSRIQIGDNRTVDLHQLHVQVMYEGGAASVSQRDMWAVIGGRLGFIQFPGTDSEPARSGPGIAQQLHNTYDQYLQHFESAYILTVKDRSHPGSQQHHIHQVNPNAHAIGNNATSGTSGNPAEVPSNPQRSVPSPQVIAAALRYVHTSAEVMRKQNLPEPLIAFVERHRPELMKLYDQQVQWLTRKNAEHEQQNMASTQGSFPSMHEQTSIGLQPVVQRLPQSIGASPTVSIAGESKMGNGAFIPEAATQKQPPTNVQVQQAHMMINQIKIGFQHSLATMGTQLIAEELRQDFHQLLDQVYRMSLELDARLPIYLAVLKNKDVISKIVAIVLTVMKQWQLLATSSPAQYIVSMVTLRNMQLQIHKLNEEFENQWRAIKASANLPAANSQHHVSLTPARLNPAAPLSVPPTQNISHVSPAASQSNGRPTSINSSPQPPPSQSQLQPPPPSQSQLQPNQHQPYSHPSSIPQQLKKSFQPSLPRSPSSAPPPAALTSPIPSPAAAAASTSTPAANMATPQPPNSSPQTPKSPPSKAPAKTKGPTRVNRKMSTASRGPGTPETVSAVVGAKRPLEDDVAALANIAPSEAEASNAPSPKKAKTEWEGEASEALLKRQQEIENIKTDEDAAAFFDRMKELFAMTASTDNGIHHDIASSLDQILAGVAQEPADVAATAVGLSIHGPGDTGVPPTALSPHTGPANDAFLEFVDFSSFTTLEDEDNDSKAPTPDLVPSSETNPSPESGSEGDLLGGDKSKIDEPGDRSDPLRLGSLREIDGGESAYYQGGDWKWEGPMPTLDQPWAIFTS